MAQKYPDFNDYFKEAGKDLLLPLIYSMKLNYRQIGTGRPVLILHGLFGMSDNWQSFGRMLEAQNYSAYLVDLRNHGLSPHHTLHNYPVMAADVAELIQNLQLEKPVVIGHSMGGKVAMQLAIDYPELVSKIVVVDIAPYAYPIHHREILDALLSLDLNEIKTRSEAEKKLSENMAELSTRQFLLKNLYWITPEKLSWRFNLKALNEQIDEIGEPTWPSSPVYNPALFLRGENSNYIDISRVEEIKKLFPQSQFITIKNAGHWIHADQPKLLLDVVLKFIEE
jgi:esterase